MESIEVGLESEYALPEANERYLREVGHRCVMDARGQAVTADAAGLR